LKPIVIRDSKGNLNILEYYSTSNTRDP